MMVLLHKTVCRNGSKQYALQCFCIPQKVIFNLREQAAFNLPNDSFVRNPDDSALVADVFLDLNKLMNLNRKNGIFFYELDCSKKCQAISSL